MTATILPSLAAETVPVDHFRGLLPFVDPHDPLAWIRNGEGIVGIGSCLRLEFSGPTRFTDAAARWRAISTAARVTDPVVVSGTGLIAFGTFAFSDWSHERSVLIVPDLVLGRRNGVSWLTRIRAENDDDGCDARARHRDGGLNAIPDPLPFGIETEIAFTPGKMSADAYRAAVATTITFIKQHRLSKAIIARDLVGHLPREADIRVPMTTLAEQYPDTWTFAVDGLVGSSPETLVSVSGREVRARVLAGTVARGADARADSEAEAILRGSAKDHDEHEFAVHSVFSALTRHSKDLSRSEKPSPLKLPNLWHLATDFIGTLSDGSSSLDLVAALHPTAAVAGTPTLDALELIEELEPFDRGRYAGPVGWVGARGNGEWAIALRCAQIASDGAVTAYAGAGIIGASEPERELAETRMKFQPIVDAFGSVEQSTQ